MKKLGLQLEITEFLYITTIFTLIFVFIPTSLLSQIVKSKKVHKKQHMKQFKELGGGKRRTKTEKNQESPEMPEAGYDASGAPSVVAANTGREPDKHKRLISPQNVLRQPGRNLSLMLPFSSGGWCGTAS